MFLNIYTSSLISYSNSDSCILNESISLILGCVYSSLSHSSMFLYKCIYLLSSYYNMCNYTIFWFMITRCSKCYFSKAWILLILSPSFYWLCVDDKACSQSLIPFEISWNFCVLSPQFSVNLLTLRSLPKSFTCYYSFLNSITLLSKRFIVLSIHWVYSFRSNSYKTSGSSSGGWAMAVLSIWWSWWCWWLQLVLYTVFIPFYPIV